jgi:hypothetical protein
MTATKRPHELTAKTTLGSSDIVVVDNSSDTAASKMAPADMLKAFGPAKQFTPPVSADFSWVNQASAALDLTGNGIFMSASGQSADAISARVKTAPATPYTITARVDYSLLGQNFNGAGLCWRLAASGQFVTVGATFDSVPKLAVTKYSSPSVQHSSYLAVGSEPPPWIRLSDDGTTRSAQVSKDGVRWNTVVSHVRTDFLTANQVGFFVNPYESGTLLNVGMNLLSWAEA